MLSKRIPMHALQVESYLRSQQLYIRREALPAPPVHSETNFASTDDQKRSPEPQTDMFSATVNTRQVMPELSRTCAACLHALAASESFTLTEQHLRLTVGITSGSQIDNTRRQLLQLGYIEIHKILRAKNYLNIWTLAPKGLDHLHIYTKPKGSVGGSQLHTFLAHAVRVFARSQGYKALLEVQLDNGKLVDVLARNETDVRCYEVGLPPLDKEVQNTAKILESSLNPHRIIHVVKNSKDKKHLEELLRQDARITPHLDKVEVKLAGNFVSLSTSKSTSDTE